MIAVITADLVDSSFYEESLLNTVLNKLRQEFKQLEKKNKPKVRFEIYRGDSFQGVIYRPEDALKIMLQIKTAINQVHLKQTRSKAYAKVADFKIALGIGNCDFERESIAESNGQAFQFSGRTLDSLKTEDRFTKLLSPNEEVNAEFDSSLYLLDILMNRWSTASAEVVYYLLQGQKEKEIAEKLKISQSAVNQRKKSSGWDAIVVLLQRYEQVIIKNFRQ